MGWGTGSDVVLSKSKESSILYSSGGGNAVYQYVETLITEKRGVAKATAQNAVTVSDNTVQTVYYKMIDGEIQSFVATTGSKTTTTASRNNEADGWIETTTTETYTTSLTADSGWATAFSSTTGVAVKAGKRIASSILFSKSGATTIYQVETETITEYRGEDESTSTARVVFGDTTSQTQYWAQIDGEVYTISPTSGKRTTWSASRQANGVWVATKTEVEYSVTPAIGSPWGTTKLDQDGKAATKTTSGTAHTSNIEKNFSYEWAVSDDILLTSVERKDTVYEYVSTEAAAQAIVDNNTSNSLVYTEVKHLLYSFLVPVYVYRIVPVGVIKTASASYNSEEKGWTVTVTETTYGWTQNSGGGWGVA